MNKQERGLRAAFFIVCCFKRFDILLEIDRGRSGRKLNDSAFALKRWNEFRPNELNKKSSPG
jgi:hypothetical protein